MASQAYRNEPEVEKQFVELELAALRAAVRRQNVLLVLAVALGVTTIIVTIISALHGSGWSVPAGSGTSTGLTGAAAAINGRQQR